jgi:chromosomal replication initiation ATPase DnaA
LQNLTAPQKEYCQPSINQFKKILNIETIVEAIKKYFSIDTLQLKKSSRGGKNIPRLLAIFIAKFYGQMTHQQIANYFTSIKANSISTLILRINDLLDKNLEIRKHFENIKLMLIGVT